MEKPDAPLGKVIISPRVLKTIARFTALADPEVVRMAEPSLFRWRVPSGGIALRVKDDTVSLDLYVVADAEANFYEMGRRLQQAVAQAIENILGMNVAEVNVHIEGVAKAVKSAG